MNNRNNHSFRVTSQLAEMGPDYSLKRKTHFCSITEYAIRSPGYPAPQDEIVCLFISLFIWSYAVFNIISVNLRRQFTYSLHLGKQTITRLGNGACPRAISPWPPRFWIEPGTPGSKAHGWFQSLYINIYFVIVDIILSKKQHIEVFICYLWYTT